MQIRSEPTRSVTVVMIAAFVATLISAPVPLRAQQTAASTASAASAPAEVAAAIDSIARAAVRDRPLAGLSITVVRGADTLAAAGYGYAELEHRVPATAQTVHRLGSLTKQFTAAAVLRLVERGELGLDDPITKFLPDYPTQGHDVAVRHLLNHTSGIKSYTGMDEFWERSRLDLSHDELIDMFSTEPFDFEPGEEYRYNNSGYYLLGVIIERVTGDSYEDHLRADLFEPQALERTSYCRNAPIIEGRAEGYRVDEDDFLNDEYLSMNTPGAAGALCSTTLDLIAWNRALHGGRVLAPESYRLMTSPTVLANGDTIDYGYGLGLGQLGGQRKIAHGGGINGFNTYLSYYPEVDLSIAVLTNTAGGRPADIEERIARTVLGLPEPTMASVPLPDDAVERYAGTYRIDDLEIRIFLREDALMAQATGQAAFELLYQGDDEFVAEFDESVRLVFERDGGRAARFTLHQGPRPMTAVRVP